MADRLTGVSENWQIHYRMPVLQRVLTTEDNIGFYIIFYVGKVEVNDDRGIMKRELIKGEKRGCWQSYTIVSDVGRDKYFQGSIELPMNKESEEISNNILKVISKAFNEVEVEIWNGNR